MNPLKNGPAFLSLILSPERIYHLEGSRLKKVGLIALSLLIGIPLAFTPHLIYWIYRKVTELKPDRTIPLAKKRVFEKVDHVALKQHIPIVTGQFNQKPSYGKGAKYLGHVTGHQVIGKTSLEGANMNEILGKVVPFFQTWEKTHGGNELKPLLEELEKGLQIASCGSKEHFIAQVQKEISLGKPVLIPSGWTGLPTGHAIYMEVTPTEQNKCEVKLFNLGAGSQYHGVSDQKHIPSITWTGIDLDRASSKEFLQAVYELRHSPQKRDKTPTSYGEEDIYRACKSLLNPGGESVSFTEDRLMTPQEIGICAWKSLTAFLSSRLEKELYKKLMAEMKIDAILGFATENQGEISEESLHLFEESIKSTSNYLEKQIQKGHLDPSLRKEALEKFAAAKQKLPPLKINQTPLGEEIKFDPIGDTAHLFRGLWRGGKKINLDDAQNIVSREGLKLLDEVRALNQKTLESGATRFKKLLALLNQPQDLWKKERLAVHQSLLEFVKELPLKSADWKKSVSKSEAKEILSKTLEIAQMALANGFELSEVMQPEQIYILKKLHLVQETLGEIAFPTSYGMFNTELISNKGLGAWDNLFDGTLRKGLPQITHWKKGLNIYESQSWRDASSPLDVTLYKSNLEDSSFQKTLKEHFPKYLSDLAKNHPTDPEWALLGHAWIDKELPTPLKAILYTNYYLQAAPRIYGEFEKPSDITPHLSCKRDPTHNWFDLKANFRSFQHSASRLLLLGGRIDEPAYQELEKIIGLPETEFLTMKFDETLLKKWSEEELRLLLRMFSSEKTSHTDLLAFCKEHEGAIFEHDFQRLFIRVLLKGDPGPQLTHLADWISQQIKTLSASRSEEFSTLAFLLRASRYAEKMSEKGPSFPESLFKTIETLKKNAAEDPAQRLIYLEEMLHLSEKIEVSDKDLLNFSKAASYLSFSPLTSEDIDPIWRFEVDKAKLKMARKTAAWIEKNPSQIDLILQESVPGHPQGVWKEEKEGVFKNEMGDTFHLYSFRFDLKKEYGKEQAISLKIADSFAFRYLFPNVTKGKLVGGDHPFYEFLDPSTKRRSRAYFDGKIQQEIEGFFWTWAPAENLFDENTALLGSAALTFRMHHFTGENSQIRSEDPLTHKLSYLSTVGMQNIQVEDAKTKWQLSKPSKLFQRLAHPLTIEEWYDKEEKLQKCDLPTLGLHFVNKENHLYCEEIPGYYIDLEKAAPSVIPRCPFGITLQNEKGEKKFILPKLDKIKPDMGSQEARIPHFKAEFSLESALPNEEKFHIYDLKKENHPETKSLGSELYLASTYNLFGSYQRAFDILKKHRGQLLSFDEYPGLGASLKRIFETKEITGNKTPNAVALSLFAGLLLIKNRLNYPTGERKSPVNLTKLSEMYTRFLKKEHYVHAVKFNREEELFLIETLDQRGENPLFQERKDFLEGREKKGRKETLSQHFVTSPRIFINKNILNNEKFETIDENICDKELLTRPLLQKNIGSYYALAREGTPEQKEWLKSALFFVEESLPSETEFLRCVMKHPEKFSPWEKGDDWKEKHIKVLKEFSSSADEKTPPSKSMPFTQKPVTFFTKLAPVNPLKEPLSFAIPLIKEGLMLEGMIQKSVTDKKIAPELEEFLKQGEKKTSPLEKAEYERLQKDLAYFKTHSHEIAYEILDKPALDKALSGEVDLKGREQAILKLANAVPKEQRELLLQGRGGHLTEFTLEELLVNFARQKPALLQEKNPSLTETEIKDLYEKLSEYLLLATQNQQIERVKSALQRGNVEEACEMALAKRNYTVNPSKKETMAYLAFEYFSNLLLREAQVSLQKNFLENLEECLAQEMIMGSGKSKVILILLALLRADGKKISTVVVASQFFKDVALHTHDILQKAFEQTLKALHFDRGTPITPESLNEILETLESVKTNQNCLIVTSKSLQCLSLRFKEEWVQFFESSRENPPKELLLLQKILSKIYEEADLLIDELDTVLNVLHTVSFSLGKKEKPDPAHLQTNEALYKILYQDPEIKKIAQLESDPHPSEGAPPLTKEIYKAQIKAPLAKKFLQKLPHLGLEMGSFNQEALVDFLCQDPDLEKERAKKANSAYMALSEKERNIIAAGAVQIGHLLENTLTKTSNEKYGICEDGLFAIPFAAANTPSRGSEFASHTVTYNYTLQSIVKHGLSPYQIKQPLQELRRRIKNSPDAVDEKDTLLLDTWEEKLGKSFFGKNTNWDALRQKINGDPALKFAYFQDFILPKMEFYTKKMTSTAQEIPEFARAEKGFTGTLWNATTFHEKIKASPEIGTDSQTLSLLFSHSNKPAELWTEKNPRKVLESLGTPPLSFEMLIDAGGNFKELDNLTVARTLAKTSGKPVVFYHNKVQTVTNGQKEDLFKNTSYKAGEYLTYLDQANTTGADIAQSGKAKGLVTIKADMLQRDLLQAVWRLRGLAKGQTIDFAMDAKTTALIRGKLNLDPNAPIGLPEILSYTIQNQSAQLARDNYAACLGQLENVKEQLLNSALLSEDPLAQKRALFGKLETVVCKSDFSKTPAKAFFCIPAMIDTGKFLEQKGKDVILEIKALPISDSAKKTGIERVEKIIERYSKPGMLLEKIQSPQATSEETVEVEKETQQEVEVEVEVVRDTSERADKLKYIGKETLKRISPKNDGSLIRDDKAFYYMSLSTYFEKHPEFKDLKLEKAFSDISVSLNFLEKNSDTDPFLHNFHLYHRYQKEVDYVILERSGATLISQEEATALSKDARLFSIKTLQYVNQEKTALLTRQIETITKLQFLGGISHYGEEMLPFLKGWIKKSPKLESLFKMALQRSATRRIEFKSSPLAKVFKSL